MPNIRVAISIALGSVLACSSPACAGSSQVGQITSLGVEQGRVFFFTNGSRGGMPSCASAGARWVFNGATAEGQAMMSVLLTYYASGKLVVVQGTGACADWGDTESVEYIWSAS